MANRLDLPAVEDETRPYWEAAKQGRLWVAAMPTSTGDWVVGCVGVVPKPSHKEAQAELIKMYVHPRLRRQGLARRLASRPAQPAPETPLPSRALHA